MSIPSHLDRFGLTFVATVQLISELNKSVYEQGHTDVHPALFSVAEAYLKSMDKVELLTSFVRRTMPYWSKIRCKDTDFFINNASSIFGEVKLVDLPSALKNIYTAVTPRGDPIVPYVDRDAVFSYFGSMIKIAIKYLNENPIDNNLKVNAIEQAQLWSIVL